MASLDELAQPELWESEQEFQDFLADLYASRRSDISWASSCWTPTWPQRSFADVFLPRCPAD